VKAIKVILGMQETLDAVPTRSIAFAGVAMRS
jgi:hypothetical protein